METKTFVSIQDTHGLATKLELKTREWSGVDLTPDCLISIHAPGVCGNVNLGPDDLLALAKGAMAARSHFIQIATESGVRDAADDIWHSMQNGHLHYA